jgi:hypothetical protein
MDKFYMQEEYECIKDVEASCLITGVKLEIKKGERIWFADNLEGYFQIESLEYKIGYGSRNWKEHWQRVCFPKTCFKKIEKKNSKKNVYKLPKTFGNIIVKEIIFNMANPVIEKWQEIIIIRRDKICLGCVEETIGVYKYDPLKKEYYFLMNEEATSSKVAAEDLKLAISHGYSYLKQERVG